MIEGVKAPDECKPTIFCKFVFPLSYLPFARVEADQILQAGSWGREILKTEQEIRLSETWTFFRLPSVPKSLTLSGPIQLRWTTFYLFIFFFTIIIDEQVVVYKHTKKY